MCAEPEQVRRKLSDLLELELQMVVLLDIMASVVLPHFLLELEVQHESLKMPSRP